MSTKTKTSKGSDKQATANKINDFNKAKEEFLARRQAQIEQREIEKEEKRAERSDGVKHLGKEDFLRLLILNSGDKGVDVETLISEGEKYTNKAGEIKPISEITIKHNWNRDSLVQRGEEKLQKAGVDVNFDVEIQENTKKGVKLNNLIKVVPFSVEPLKAYLLDKGATPEMFETA